MQGAHKAIVADDRGRFITPLLTFHTRPSDLNTLLSRARQGAEAETLQVVMEPTGMAWFPIAVYLARQGVLVYLVDSQKVADLRRFYKRHAKSDRIDARLPVVAEDKLHRLVLPGAAALACQRGCRELDRLSTQSTAIKNRLQAIDRLAWPGLEDLVFPDYLGPAARWFRQHWYHPQQVVEAGAEVIRQAWCASGAEPTDPGD